MHETEMRGKMNPAPQSLQLFLADLRRHRGRLSRQAIQTLRGQALHGDVEAARKGMQTILNRKSTIQSST